MLKIGKEMAIVMMETTIKDVNGMEEIVVVIMLIQISVQCVNVLGHYPINSVFLLTTFMSCSKQQFEMK